MTIQITNPEVEEVINERLRSGAFKDAEDVILQALQSSSPTAPLPSVAPAKGIVELFAPLRGLNLDFGRNPSTGRPVDLRTAIGLTPTSLQNSAGTGPNLASPRG